MTIVERIAAAIAASRTGRIGDWQAYRADAARMIERYDACIAARRDAETKKP